MLRKQTRLKAIAAFSLYIYLDRYSSRGTWMVEFVRGNCVFTPILNFNCDFTSTFFHFAFLPLLFGNEASF